MRTYLFADSVFSTLPQFVGANKIHAIVVHLTAALILVSLGNGKPGRVLGMEAVRDNAGSPTGWFSALRFYPTRW